jgi:DNA-binding transcriptional regulator YiaG
MGTEMPSLDTATAARELVIREVRRLPREGPERSSLTTTLAFVKVLDSCLAKLNHWASLPEERELIVREAALQDGFLPFLAYLHSTVESASECVLATWGRSAHLLGQLPNEFAQTASCEPIDQAIPHQPESLIREHLSTFNLAVSEVLREHTAEPNARLIIRELLEKLGLSYDDLGRVLRVSGETVRRWERGLSSVPRQRLAELEVADNALRRILRILRPETLPSVIRRPAALFDGAPALDWIRMGRIGEVADRYETNFAYQG